MLLTIILFTLGGVILFSFFLNRSRLSQNQTVIKRKITISESIKYSINSVPTIGEEFKYINNKIEKGDLVKHLQERYIAEGAELVVSFKDEDLIIEVRDTRIKDDYFSVISILNNKTAFIDSDIENAENRLSKIKSKLINFITHEKIYDKQVFNKAGFKQLSLIISGNTIESIDISDGIWEYN